MQIKNLILLLIVNASTFLKIREYQKKVFPHNTTLNFSTEVMQLSKEIF
jgi:hypothetical protein